MPRIHTIPKKKPSSLYYGFRFYSPELGRWLSRDPIGENPIILRVGVDRFLKDLRNIYLFVENDPIKNWDTLGLWVNNNEVADASFASCNRCGPDVTGDIEQEFRRLHDVIAGYPWDRAPDTFTSLKWFASLALAMNYSANTQNGRIANVGGLCPSPDCAGTLTLCGKCVGADVPGNLMYGFAAKEFGISILLRNLAADAAEIWDTIRHFEDWEVLEPMSDFNTFDLGRRMASGRISFCQAIEGLPSAKVNSNCQKCDGGCDSFPRANWPVYPNQ